MTIKNPYPDDPEKAKVWEEGYVAGFTQPDNEGFPPYSNELLDIYQKGNQAGRNDRAQPLTDGTNWCAVQDVPEKKAENSEESSEFLESVIIHGIFAGLEKIFEKPILGLTGLVLEVVQIQGDTVLKPLPPEWSGPVNVENIFFFALCSMSTHSSELSGTTKEGYWAGPLRDNIFDAFRDLRIHSHSATVIVRYSPEEESFGTVWPSK